MSTIKAVTFNAGNANDKAVKADLSRIRKVADVVVLQEVSDRDHLLLPADDWSTYQPTGQGRSHNAVMWRTRRFVERRSDSTLLHEATQVGKSGAGPTVLGTGWLHRVRLLDNDSGRTLHVFGCHMVPSVVGPAASVVGQQTRRSMYRQDVLGIVLKIQELKRGQVIVGGDWNAGQEFDLLDPLRKAGLKLGYDPKASHGDRSIDFFWHVPTDWMKVVGQDSIETSSDHNAMLVKYRLEPRKTE